MEVGKINFVKFKLKELNPAVYNPRTISDEALTGLENSLKKFGCVEPIVVNTRDSRNVIVGGHQRYKILIKLHGGDYECYCVIVDLNIADEKLLNITLNNSQIQGQFIDELDNYIEQLKSQLENQQEYFDLAIDKLRSEIKDEDDGRDEDDAPEISTETICHAGNLWMLGEHRLICGNSTDKQVLTILFEGGLADLVFTDPPYNMAYKSKNLGGIRNDNMAEADFVKFILASMSIVKCFLKTGGSYYVCMSAGEYPLVYYQLRKLGLPGKQIIWMKPSVGRGCQEYRPQYEVMLYGYTGSKDDRVWNGGRGQSDLWDFNINSLVYARQEGEGMIIEVGSGIETAQICLEKKVSGIVLGFDGTSSDVWKFGRATGGYIHPTQKPVGLVERAIYNSSNEGDIVFDSFAGSGTTVIACEKTRRKCYAVELDPKYCDVIIKRWENWTGKKAELIK